MTFNIKATLGGYDTLGWDAYFQTSGGKAETTDQENSRLPPMSTVVRIYWYSGSGTLVTENSGHNKINQETYGCGGNGVF